VRTGNKIKHIHKPSTKEIFHSLSCMPSWSRILLEHKTAPYSEFLNWILEKNFLEHERHLVIKNIAKDFGGADTTKITKWISAIYNDILDLNDEQPELFRTEGIRHYLDFQYFDSYGYATVWLLTTPRRHERFSFPFFNAKVGFRVFYVEEVEHTVDNDQYTIRVSLVGRFVNRYRQQLVERARFENRISYSDARDPFSSYLDDDLKKWYS
jgi:hypothetical protein